MSQFTCPTPTDPKSLSRLTSILLLENTSTRLHNTALKHAPLSSSTSTPLKSWCCSSAPPSHELHPIRPLLRPRARAYSLDSFEGYIRLRPRPKYVLHLGYMRSVCAVNDALGRWRSSTEGSRILTITLLAKGFPLERSHAIRSSSTTFLSPA